MTSSELHGYCNVCACSIDTEDILEHAKDEHPAHVVLYMSDDGTTPIYDFTEAVVVDDD